MMGNNECNMDYKITYSEAVKKLMAYLKCKEREVKGIYEDCNNKRCDDCDLCYMQGTTGEHMTAWAQQYRHLKNRYRRNREKPIRTEVY